MKSDKPGEVWDQYKSSAKDREDYVPVDMLPNKDWLRAT